MKKTYINPNMVIANLKMQQKLLTGSDKAFSITGAGDADSGTKNGGWNSRQGGFFDDEDEE